MNDARILPRQQAEEVDHLLSSLITGAQKWENVELLDESQCYQIHHLAAQLYAAGYSDGISSEQVRQSGKWQRDRDRETPC